MPVPNAGPAIVLLDINTDRLDAASSRLARYRPERIQASVLEPFPDEMDAIDSVSLMHVLHCLPGAMADKAVVFDHVVTVLNPSGVVFGATLLHGGVRRNWYARSVMKFNNRRGIFSNTGAAKGTLLPRWPEGRRVVCRVREVTDPKSRLFRM